MNLGQRMALKFKLTPDELATVDDAIKAYYKETGEGTNKAFVLQVEGAVSSEQLREKNDKLNTFRKTNQRLAERLNIFVTNAGIQLEEDATPEDLAELLKEKREELEASLKGGAGAKSKAEIENEVVKRVEAYKTKHDADIQKLGKEKQDALAEQQKLLKEIASLSIGQEVVEVGARFGLKAKAQKVIMDAALRIFQRKDGVTRCVDAEGDPVYGSDGTTEKSVADWLENEAMKEYDFAFESNSGGGASGGSGGAGRNGNVGPNPWKRETRNLTRQMELSKRDPALAKRLEAEATGSK